MIFFRFLFEKFLKVKLTMPVTEEDVEPGGTGRG